MPPPPGQNRVKGETIPFKNEVKYLGVILDSKLSGTSHVKNKIAKAKRHLMAYHYAIRKKCGHQPLLMRRAYTSIVIPATLSKIKFKTKNKSGIWLVFDNTGGFLMV